MPATQPDRGHVLITGTSTGIGAATAIHLADLGFRVLAGVRKAADGEALRSLTSGELRPVVIDITDQASIAAAAEAVDAAVGDGGLYGLVNNAGAVWPGPLEFQPLDEFRAQLEINLVGHLAVIQALLPLIRRARGRIVNVGSIGGRLVLPIHGAYSASKFGMEALSDALRLELRQWRIHVSLVDPGATKTAIFDKTLAHLDKVVASLDERGERRYDAQVAALRRTIISTAASAGSPEDLARVIAEALTAKTPKARYLAGKGAREAIALTRTPSDRIKDAAIAREVGLPAPEAAD